MGAHRAEPAKQRDPLGDAGYRRPALFDLSAGQPADVNFVVLAPGRLPAGCRVTQATVRPEQPPGRPAGICAAALGHSDRSDGNPASVRLEVAGNHRSLRIKEFLYDFGPPSAGIAPLWGSQSVKPLDAGERVGWLGLDYRGRVGGCMQIDRTQVEFAVTSGEFSVREITDLIAGFEVVDEAGAAQIRHIPFHQLNYWVRYRKKAMGVPYGLWQYDRGRRYQHAEILSEADLARRSGTAAFLPSGAVRAALAFDSAVRIVDPEHGHLELEVVYRHASNGSDHIWLSAMNTASRLKFAVPPRRELALPAEFISRSTRPGLGTVWIAGVNRRLGAMEARFEHEGICQSVWGAPARHLGAAMFEELLADMARMEPVG